MKSQEELHDFTPPQNVPPAGAPIPEQFKRGDVVREKTGTRKMTVNSVKDSKVAVVYFDEKNIVNREVIHQDLLTKFYPEPEAMRATVSTQHFYKKYDVNAIAGRCHEENREYCQHIGDDSQVPWVDAPGNIKQSAIDGVIHIIDNPDSTPEDSHNSWLRFKEADGWVYGETKDSTAKTHPCFKPYSELPEEQKKKDEIFINTAKTMLWPSITKHVPEDQARMTVKEQATEYD